jgi:hypothetical protein
VISRSPIACSGQRLAVVQQDVLGLDVAMDHVVAVRVVQRRGDFGCDPERVADGKLLFPGDAVAQGLPLDEGHHVEQIRFRLARVEQRQDVRVLEVGGELDLGQKPLGPDHGGELGPKHLERDAAVVPEVVREVNGRHAAGTDLPVQTIAFSQRRLKPAEQFGHRSS